MLTPDEAVALVLATTPGARGEEPCPLAEASGRVLARAVRSDLDLPPFDRSAMDGYAVRRADLSGLAEGEEARLRVLGEARAGAPFEGAVPPGACVEIYTGGAVPADCDAVVMVERSRREGDLVHLADRPRERQHICERGEDLREGEVVLEAGTRVSPATISLLASVGCDPVPVVRRPRVAILTSGDELVAPTERPGPGQIRESNTLHLAALARAAGAEVVGCGVVRDDLDGLAATFAATLEGCDVLVTTGGVSMGKYDLVGEALGRVGVEQVFHKVAMKPGKPVWFGRAGERLVFGLPGNPVSCWVGLEVFVRPALARLSGLPEAAWRRPLRLGRWAGAETRPLDREQNLPARVTQAADGVDELEAVRWQGSGDLVGLSRASALAIVPPGEVLRAGDPVRFQPIA
jgi:molybdopterin molybdotransferase